MKIYVAGIGPGSPEDITPAVLAAIQDSDVVVGYKYYFQFITPYLKPGTACLDTGMKKERERAEEAFLLAEQGKTVCVISSGDAGGNNIDRNKIYNNVTQHLFGEGNNVVLMHDTNYKETTADALEDIIIYAKTNGYTLLPLTPDTRPCHHGIAN